MNDIKNLNIKLSVNNNLPNLKKLINKGNINSSIENILKEKRLENNKYFSRKKVTKITQLIIKLSDNIIYTNKSLLNLFNKNEYNLNISNSAKCTNFNNTPNKWTTKKIYMNEQQYIRLISPFNLKSASIINHIYTFTNKSYKQINKNLHNLYIICKSAFLNMSCLISKPIISSNSNLIKITLFYYWKPLRKKYLKNNWYSKFFILHNYKLENLVKLLSKLFNKSVELELIRIYSPQNESNILANLIGILSNFIKFRYIHMKLFKVSKTKRIKRRFKNNKIPSFLSGIYLKLAGRVLTQRIQRRVKSKIIQKGRLSRANTDLINTNTFVNKNKRGVFSITIRTGQIINNSLY
uniref:Small ribosomal subunit protein uS3m n=1 Tax=Russula abietina TaxID=482377 RepID=A0A2S0U3P4_9AGAM|nr:ribosomal protein S3 [Russula abietina]AWB36113.1 ribosomal protein S3 [Russula abietina]